MRANQVIERHQTRQNEATVNETPHRTQALRSKDSKMEIRPARHDAESRDARHRRQTQGHPTEARGNEVEVAVAKTEGQH
jgi:hypothetical protein